MFLTSNNIKRIKKVFYLLYKFLISLKLAVFIISLLAILTGIGTFVESRYNQEIANKLVYHSIWMNMTAILLVINLAMVLIDRWPWKRRQIGFVLAHVGILILIFGSFFTKQFGLDGSLRLEEGEKSSLVSVPDMEIKVYSSYDGKNFSLLYESPLKLFSVRPREGKLHVIQTAGEEFLIDRYIPFSVGMELFKPSSKGDSPAIRFHLDGSRADVVEWMQLESGKEILSQEFGPALIHFTKKKNFKVKTNKELALFVEGNRLSYSLAGKKKKALKLGEVFSTGWMDFQFRLLEFFPKSQRSAVFSPRDRPSDKTVKAIRISHKGESVWLGQNSYIQFFKEDRVYAIGFLNKTYNIGFDLELLDFKMLKYQGSDKAKSYESKVRFNNQTTVISMNEPLKYKNWVFYQSSFEPSKEGKEPTVSILSVNRDPGRFLKYFGSALIVAGIILLFYYRKIKTQKLKAF